MTVDWRYRVLHSDKLQSVVGDYIDAYYFSHGSCPSRSEIEKVLGISKDELSTCDDLYEQYEWFFDNMTRINKKACFEYMKTQFSDYRLYKFSWNMFIQMVAMQRFEHCINYSLLAYLYFMKLGYKPKLRCGLLFVEDIHQDTCHFWLEIDGRIFDIAVFGNLAKHLGKCVSRFIFMETYNETYHHYCQTYIPGYFVKKNEECLYDQVKNINIRERLQDGGWEWTIGLFSKDLYTDNREQFEKYIGEALTIGDLIEEGLERPMIELPVNADMRNVYRDALNEFESLLPSDVRFVNGELVKVW